MDTKTIGTPEDADGHNTCCSEIVSRQSQQAIDSLSRLPASVNYLQFGLAKREQKFHFPCRYHGDGLPDEGVLPTEFELIDAV